ncbi:MAG: hypothetical protein JNJ40_17735 [Bacteroidia bacterium]|nr:hypothetical protein [Bacteroidia bacterium]
MKGKKITTDNYFETIEEIGFENLPQALKESHMAIIAKTNEGEDWSGGADFNRMVNLAFKKLEEFVGSGNKGLSGTEHPELKRAKEDAKNYYKLSTDQLKMIYRLELDAELDDGESEWITIRKRAIEKEMKKRGVKLDGAESGIPKKKNPYSEISTEVKFINRFLDFNDKILYKKTFEIFIDELQKAIEEKKITKKSPVAKDIMAIQQAVLKAFNNMENAKHFVLSPATVKRLKVIIEKYENAYDDIDESYIKVKKKKMDLSGINNSSSQVNIMPSTDFTNLQFNAIGFKDKWLNFIGDPSPGFTAMVFGMPKMGKSYLCVDFAGYLARNHGKVLYVAKEEKLDATLQKKLKDKEVAHENLFVADALPRDLSAYDFIFLDSVNKLGLLPKDLDKLKADNKGKSFIYVFQATKGGKFKGNNEFQHDVDVVIEVPEQGKAIQFGRFNQGGELDIFGDKSIGEAEELNGVRKSGKNLDVPNKVSNVDNMKKKENQEQDWTNHPELHSIERSHLIRIKNLFEEGNMKEAMRQAAFLDTYLREMIPPKVWVEMGGELTPTGIEKLRLSSNFASRPDDINPKYLFTQTATALLVEALRGDFDLKALIRAELANRGQDDKGNWVGFEQAAKIHKIKK